MGFSGNGVLYALTQEQALKAVFIVNHSSPGLNLSELLNSIKVIVTAPTGLPWPVLATALSRLTPEFEAENVPLLIYPANYPTSQGLTVEKQYLLWILDTQYGKEYLEYMEKKTKTDPAIPLEASLAETHAEMNSPSDPQRPALEMNAPQENQLVRCLNQNCSTITRSSIVIARLTTAACLPSIAAKSLPSNYLDTHRLHRALPLHASMQSFDFCRRDHRPGGVEMHDGSDEFGTRANLL